MKKGKYVATTTTVTFALMAQRMLEESGIGTRIVRPSAEAQARGCAYGIEFDARERARVRDILARAGIQVTV